jgi:hypothetical protein
MFFKPKAMKTDDLINEFERQMIIQRLDQVYSSFI